MIRIIIGIVLLVIFFLGLLGSIFGKAGNVPSYLLFASIILLIPGVLFTYFGLRSKKLRTEPKLTTNLKEDIPNSIKVTANNVIKNDNSDSKSQYNLQPPFQNKKFTQQPVGIIFWLLLFFPVGIYFMWKEKMWSSKTRIIITAVFSFLIIVGLVGKKGNTSGDIVGINSITYTNNAQNVNSNDHNIKVDYTIKESTVWDAANNVLELMWNVSKIHKASKNVIVTIYVDQKAIGLVDAYGKIIDKIEQIEQITEDLDEIRKFNSLGDLQYGSFMGQIKFTSVANTIATGRKRWFLDGAKYGLW